MRCIGCVVIGAVFVAGGAVKVREPREPKLPPRPPRASATDAAMIAAAGLPLLRAGENHQLQIAAQANWPLPKA